MGWMLAGALSLAVTTLLVVPRGWGSNSNGPNASFPQELDLVLERDYCPWCGVPLGAHPSKGCRG